MLAVDFEVYRYLFCVVIGGAFGVVYLIHRVLSRSPGMIGMVADRDEYGEVKIFSAWNMMAAGVIMILVFMFFSGSEGSIVNVLLQDSWDYLASEGFVS